MGTAITTIIAAVLLTATRAYAEGCTLNHELYRIVPEYRAVMLDGGSIKRVMFVEWHDERLSTWKPGHNITFCPDENKMINTTINSVATLLSESATTCFFSATRLTAPLENKRDSGRCQCGPGEIYCVACRAVRRPTGDMADYIPITEKSGSLCGLCPACGRLIYRRVSLGHVDVVRGPLDVAFQQAQPRMIGMTNLCSNTHLRQER